MEKYAFYALRKIKRHLINIYQYLSYLHQKEEKLISSPFQNEQI